MLISHLMQELHMQEVDLGKWQSEAGQAYRARERQFRSITEEYTEQMRHELHRAEQRPRHDIRALKDELTQSQRNVAQTEEAARSQLQNIVSCESSELQESMQQYQHQIELAFKEQQHRFKLMEQEAVLQHQETTAQQLPLLKRQASEYYTQYKSAEGTSSKIIDNPKRTLSSRQVLQQHSKV